MSGDARRELGLDPRACRDHRPCPAGTRVDIFACVEIFIVLGGLLIATGIALLAGAPPRNLSGLV